MKNDISWAASSMAADSSIQTAIQKDILNELKTLNDFNKNIYFMLKAQNKEVAEEYMNLWEQRRLEKEEKRIRHKKQLKKVLKITIKILIILIILFGLLFCSWQAIKINYMK